MKNTRWLSLMILCTGFLLIVVDMTIVNVALPSIQRDLGYSPLAASCFSPVDWATCSAVSASS
jgi:MFS family permease